MHLILKDLVPKPNKNRFFLSFSVTLSMQNDFPIIIYGAGGHGQVIAETLELLGWKNLIFWDQNPPVSTTKWTTFSPLEGPSGKLILGMGNLAARKTILETHLHQVEFIPFSISHPTAFVSPSASVGMGTWIGPLALVHTHVNIGQHTIINSGAKVDHDVEIGNNVHIAPGATICGGVKIGDHTFVGANAIIPPGITLGSHVMIKAGSVVKTNIPDGGME